MLPQLLMHRPGFSGEMLYVLPVVLFIVPGEWLKIIVLLCLVAWAYDMMKLAVLRLYFLIIKSNDQGEKAAAVSSLCSRNLVET